MTFLWTELLWLLVCIPVLVASYRHLVRRQRSAVVFSDLKRVREAMHGAHRVRQYVPPCLLLAALVVLAFGIARPAADLSFEVDQRTIILAIDVSQSMRATDVRPSRLAAAGAAAKEFVAGLPRGPRVGVVAFSGHAAVVQVPTRNRRHVLRAIDGLELDQGTAIGTAVIAALMCLYPDQGLDGNYDIFGYNAWRDGGRIVSMPVAARSSEGDPVADPRAVPAGSNGNAAIVLMTDGRNTAGPPPRLAAAMAAARGVRVFTVGFGTESGTVPTETGGTLSAALDEDVLRWIAGHTRGTYTRAMSAGSLAEAYRTLAPNLQLERRPETEMTAVFAMGAALLLVAAAASSLVWSGRIA